MQCHFFEGQTPPFSILFYPLYPVHSRGGQRGADTPLFYPFYPLYPVHSPDGLNRLHRKLPITQAGRGGAQTDLIRCGKLAAQVAEFGPLMDDF